MFSCKFDITIVDNHANGKKKEMLLDLCQMSEWNLHEKWTESVMQKFNSIGTYYFDGLLIISQKSELNKLYSLVKIINLK